MVLFFVVQIFFKKRVLDEDGYILAVKKNGLQVLIPKYGLEGIVYLSKTARTNQFVFNEEVRMVNGNWVLGWLCGLVVRALARDRKVASSVDSQPVRYRVTTLGKLFTPTCLCHQAV